LRLGAEKRLAFSVDLFDIRQEASCVEIKLISFKRGRLAQLLLQPPEDIWAGRQ
jgi:hypothetical protein